MSECHFVQVQSDLTAIIIPRNIYEKYIRYRYTDTIYSRNGVNQMWILKNSKELLEHLKSKAISKDSSNKTFDFSTLYTTIPHEQLKSHLIDLI